MLKRNFVLPVIFTALLGFSVTASAQQAHKGGYFGVQYVALDTEASVFVPGVDSDVGIEASTPMIMLNIGSQISPYFAIESRLGFSGGDDTFTVRFQGDSADTGIKAEIGPYFGLFGRVGAPSTAKFAPYLMFGYGNIDFEFGGSSGDDSDLAYGVGANLNVSDSVGINVEYMNYFDEEETGIGHVEISGFSLGIQYRY